MLQIGAFEAKNTLGALLDRVACGEEIIITRRGKPVARMVPDSAYAQKKEAAAKKKRALQAIENMKKLRKGMILGPGITIKELIEEGRM